MLSGFVNVGIAAAGIAWTVIAFSMGGGAIALFGIFFVTVAIAMGIYNFKNATSKNRYSSFDITEDGEEDDPLNQKFGNTGKNYGGKSAFCPYCGAKVDSDYEFCNKCGRRLPQ